MTRRVLQVDAGSAFDDGLASLLRRAADLDVQSLTYTDDATFVRDVTYIRPDVILLNEAGPLSLAQMLKLLARVPAWAPVRIIVVNVSDNAIDIYDVREWKQVVLTRSDDLMTFIRGGHRA